MPPIALSVPADRTAPPKDLEIRPKHIKAWIDSLPLAQSLDASRKLCAHLAALNRAKVDVDTRLQILDVYRPIALMALEELDAVYGKATLPVGPRAREALLLSLTDPYRLVQGEADKILAQARGYRGVVSLARERPATRSSAHFIIPCDMDKAPKPALSANDDTGGPNWRLLDANAIVDKLRAKKQAAETGQVSATLSKSLGPEGVALLGRLIVLWGEPPKRSE